ncbi:MAG: hypothetical protein HQL25_01975 [Candidatus Omnitrophica bacterium]|nr:hypothetical protein [Candidatus Omnitrophota bacterium]
MKKQTISSLNRWIRSIILLIVTFNFVLPTNFTSAQIINNPNLLVSSKPFSPVILNGITLDPQNPFKMDFIVNVGDTHYTAQTPELKTESNKLIKYFLASLTVPKEELWVNLNPREDKRIIPQKFGQTEMGRDLLAQDYILKKLTASLLFPESEIGQKFWSTIYEKIHAKYGDKELPIDTLNKIWIVPSSATIYINGYHVFLTQSHLSVMTENEYMSSQAKGEKSKAKGEGLSPIASQIIKEIIIPEIEKEVNTGKNFANLRQIYNSLILAAWYKNNLKDALLNSVYADKNKIKGVDQNDPDAAQKIYKQYIKLFEDGVFNYIKEEYDPTQQTVIAKKYISGGAVTIAPTNIKTIGKLGVPGDPAMIQDDPTDDNRAFNVSVELSQESEGAQAKRVESYRAAITKLHSLGFTHLLDDWEQLSDQQKDHRLDQILNKIDWNLYIDYRNRYILHPAETKLPEINAEVTATSYDQVPDSDLKTAEDNLKFGEKDDKSKIMVIFVMGGTGTKFRALDPNMPKGMFPGRALSNDKLFDWAADAVLGTARLYGHTKPFPTIFMTSDITDAATQEYYNSQPWFKFFTGRHMFVQQKSLPITSKATLMPFVNANHEIQVGGTGHGDAFQDILQRSDVIEFAKQFGVEHVIYAPIDDPLFPIAFKQLLGQHIKDWEQTYHSNPDNLPAGYAHVSLGLIPLKSQEDRLGRVALGANGLPISIEYGDAAKIKTNFPWQNGDPSFRIATLASLQHAAEIPVNIDGGKTYVTVDGTAVTGLKFENSSGKINRVGANILFPQRDDVFMPIKGPEDYPTVFANQTRYWKTRLFNIIEKHWNASDAKKLFGNADIFIAINSAAAHQMSNDELYNKLKSAGIIWKIIDGIMYFKSSYKKGGLLINENLESGEWSVELLEPDDDRLKSLSKDTAMLSSPESIQELSDSLFKLLGINSPSTNNSQNAKILKTLKLLDFLNFIVENTDHPQKFWDLLPAETKPDPDSWVSQNAPALNNFTVVSLQFEAGLDRRLIEAIDARYGEEAVRIVAQLTMTGGLGALMHDLGVATKKNGMDTITVNPLYTDNIKQDQTKSTKPIEKLVKEKKISALGDIVRSVLDKTEMTFTFTLEDDEFKESANTELAKEVMGKKITCDILEGKSKFADVPMYYIDAYFLNTSGERVSIFNELYPDHETKKQSDWRTVQMAVYQRASERLMLELQKQKLINPNLVVLQNEVFASLPLPNLPRERTIIHHINHTVWEPGMYKPAAYSHKLLLFTDADNYIIHDGEINLAEYVANNADFISGVGLYEHTPVLRTDIFSAYKHKVWGWAQNGLRNTNGALFDQWEGYEGRALISAFKENLGLDPRIPDKEFYETLEKNPTEKEKFLDIFEHIKSLYILDMLLLLERTQSESGGSNWRTDLFKKADLTDDGNALRKEYAEQITQAISQVSNAPTFSEKLIKLKNVLMANPIATNLRRQVPYKGPDKYKEILEMLNNTDELEHFRNSQTHLPIGGRSFDPDSTKLFNKLRKTATELQLLDQLAFIDDYNLRDAPTFARAASGCVMLSDELLEAASTFMEKGVISGASLIGVWGGAMPELFEILDTETNTTINVLETIITYDSLVQGLKSGRYIITNGDLVYYSEDKSNQKGGGRRPSAQSLFKALKDLGAHIHKNKSTRRARIFSNLKNNYRVNIVESQARANIMLWNEAIKQKQFTAELLTFIDQNPEIKKALKDADQNGNGFIWKHDPWMKHEPVTDEVSPPGLHGFLASYKKLTHQKNILAFVIGFHFSNGHPNNGDIFDYIMNTLLADPRLKPLKNIINQFTGFSNTVPESDKAVIQKTTKRVGGIDLNYDQLNLTIKRDSNNIPLPLDQQSIQIKNIDWLTPIIIDIKPIPNMQLLLGMKENYKKEKDRV